MTKRQERHHSFSDDPQKVKEAGRKSEQNANVAPDKAEKARIGGQHSHGGTRGER
jgi:general stress protein YciG